MTTKLRGALAGYGYIPPAGTTGQVLAKRSNDDGDTHWRGVTGEGDVRNYGTGQEAIQAALNVGGEVFIDGSTYNLTSPVTLSSNTTIRCHRNAVINQTTAGQPAIKGSDVSNVTIIGGTWTGTDTTTAIDGGDGGVIYIDNRGSSNGNIRIVDTTVSRSGTAGICVLNASGVWIERNEVSNVADYCILASRCSNFHIDANYVHDSAETGAANTYGIMATGNSSEPTERCSISHNKIVNFASWDGIMSHDCTKIAVLGNTIDNVRIGIDIGHSDGTNVIEDVLVANNTVHLTSTDNWSNASAMHGGVLVVGHSSANVKRVVVSGNIVRNGFNMTGSTPAAHAACISVENAEYAAVTGNVISDIGSIGGTRIGILLAGDQTVTACTGNVIQGDANSGGIRTTNILSDVLSITANSISMNITSNPAVMIGSGTYSNLSIADNPTNAVPYDEIGSPTITLGGRTRTNSVVLGGATPSVGAGYIGLGITTDTAATNGTGAAMPANVEGFLEVNIAGTIRKIPFVKD